jgi:hypothetical protein
MVHNAIAGLNPSNFKRARPSREKQFPPADTFAARRKPVGHCTQIEAVQNSFLGHPSFARHCHAPVHQSDFAGGVSIGIRPISSSRSATAAASRVAVLLSDAVMIVLPIGARKLRTVHAWRDAQCWRMRRALYGQDEFSCSFDLASDAYVRFVPLHRNSATAIALGRRF